ncbi:MAG TPA: ABC transporter permease [Planctomycetota bacterium]|nr:ABC transporter permease [Planctomycetota bacterium]
MADGPVSGFLGSLGGRGLGFFRYLGGMGYLLKESVWDFLSLVFRAAGTRRGGGRAVAAQMVRVGVRSIPIVCLVLFFVGMILAFQMAYVLRDLGAPQAVPITVGVAMLRELGPLLTAIVLTGFAGASIAAEIGTMVVGEEILALETSALNPVRFLVMPRLIAAVIMLLCLTIVANLVGILGGFVISVSLLDMSPNFYYANTVDFLKMQDLITGLVKSVAFGALIALIACQEGLKVSGGAEGVGRATTQSVVFGIVAIIITDLFFSWLFYTVL